MALSTIGVHKGEKLTSIDEKIVKMDVDTSIDKKLEINDSSDRLLKPFKIEARDIILKSFLFKKEL
jgi:hypothetical protein